MSRHKHFEDLRDAMLAAMASPYLDIPGEAATSNPLAVLDNTTTAAPVQALLAAWAIVADVLTFYQQRIADECALSTAREDRSAYAIARTVGYEPRPAISARTVLAFSVATVRPEQKTVLVPKGTGVGNVPLPGKLPAVFETSEDLEADPAWNQVAYAYDDAPRPLRLAPAATRLLLQGTAPVAPGTALALRVRRPGSHGITPIAVIAAEATADPARDAMLLRWRTRTAIAGGEQLLDAVVLDVRVRPFGALAPSFENASPAQRRPYAFGGLRVRRDGAWAERWNGIDGVPVALAIAPSGVYAITPAQLIRSPAPKTWIPSAPFPGAVLQTIVATPAGRLAVGTTMGQVFVSIDDGLTWLTIGDDLGAPAGAKLGRYQTRRLPALPVRAIAIDERSEVPVVFVATDRGIASIPLNGEAWTWRNDGLPGTDATTGFASAAATSLVFADEYGTLLAATTYGVYRSTLAERWSRVQGLGAVSQVAALPGVLLAAGPGGVFRSADGGSTWERWEPDGAVAGVPRCLAANVTTAAVAVGNDVYTSHDAGEHWERSPDPLQSPVAALAVGPDGTVAAAAPVVDNPLSDWPELDTMIDGQVIYLDREIPLAPGDVIAVSLQGSDVLAEAYTVVKSETTMESRFGMAAMSTVVTVDRAVSPDLAKTRSAVIHTGTRVRHGVPVHRETPPPPRSSLLVRRGLPKLKNGSGVAVDGLPPRIMLRGVAGGTIRIPLGDGAPGTAAAPYPWPPAAAGGIDPDYDVAAATAWGERGVVLARFDGVWLRDDVTSETSPWLRLADPPVAVTGLARFGDVLYACGRPPRGPRPPRDAPPQPSAAGVYRWSDGRTWVAEPDLLGAIDRLFAAGETLFAAGSRGLYEKRGGGWRASPAIFDRRTVRHVAGDGGTLLAACDDGVYAREGTGRWKRVPGLDGYGVNAVAVAGGFWYAGTRGAGIWCRSAGGVAPWRPLDVNRRTGDVRALFVTADVVLAAERGEGVTRGAPYDARNPAAGARAFVPGTLASNVRAFVPLASEAGTFALAFAGVARCPSANARATPTPMRERLDALDLTELELTSLDAAILPPSLRSRLEPIVQVKLDAAEVVVEDSGQAWRLRVDDVIPIYLLRRGPLVPVGGSARADLFKVHQYELAAPPVPLDARETAPPSAGTVCRWPMRGGDARERPSLIAAPHELWNAPARADATPRSEIATVAVHDPGEVQLTGLLRHAYDPRTVRIAGNTVAATHGATIASDEVIASGDSAQSAQSARLAKKPLTYVLADGAPRPELKVWVRALPSDPVAATAALAGRTGAEESASWSYAPNFLASTKKSRHFIVRPDPDGAATLTFGDAEKGRRLPTGTNNVVARYRTGGGPDGNVPANALTLFQTAVLGGERARNPVAARGGVDAERVADVRRNVSRGLVSLSRIVARSDLEDFVAAWPGVAKVDVARERGKTAAFLVTYASAGGDAVDVEQLKRELERNGAAGWKIAIVPCRRRRFTVAARLLLRGDAIASEVIDAASCALADAFAFENRALREGVKASAVMALLQRVRGVRAVVLEALYESGTNRAVHDLPADAEGAAEAASVLYLEARDVSLTPLLATGDEDEE